MHLLLEVLCLWVSSLCLAYAGIAKDQLMAWKSTLRQKIILVLKPIEVVSIQKLWPQMALVTSNGLNGLKWSQCSQMASNDLIWPEMVSMASNDLNGLKWSQMASNGFKWPKKASNDLKWPQWPQMVSMASNGLKLTMFHIHPD